ncbi:hypothetical protein MD484_g1339, partial [Candolleomyces efflorescens]
MSTSRGPSKINGRYHTTKGAIRETFGRVLGLSGVEARGKVERTRGSTEYHAARATGYAKGTGNRVDGGADRVVGAITGDSSREMGGKIKNEKGAIGQAFNRH